MHVSMRSPGTSDPRVSAVGAPVTPWINTPPAGDECHAALVISHTTAARLGAASSGHGYSNLVDTDHTYP